MSMSGSVIAIHYTGYNLSGSTLTVYGDGCSGGWLNLPSGWTNQIASTWSSCTVSHWDYFYLTGDVEFTFGASNLWFMAYRTNSLQYS